MLLEYISILCPHWLMHINLIFRLLPYLNKNRFYLKFILAHLLETNNILATLNLICQLITQVYYLKNTFPISLIFFIINFVNDNIEKELREYLYYSFHFIIIFDKSGFWQNHSTQRVLCYVADFRHELVHASWLLELAKAFDSVEHSIIQVEWQRLWDHTVSFFMAKCDQCSKPLVW